MVNNQSDRFFTRKAIIGWILLILIPIVFPHMSTLEGKYLPVTSKLDIIKIVDLDNGEKKVWVQFTKHRQCELIGINWYKGSERVSFRYGIDDDSDQSRPKGFQTAGPWLVKTDNILDTRVEVKHQCHPLWVTITRIFP